MKDEKEQAMPSPTMDVAFGGNGVIAHDGGSIHPSSLILHPSTFKAERDGASSVLVTSTSTLFSWARLSSLWQMSFGLACCAIEMMATSASHYDMMRFGVIPRPSPRQSDLIIISGTVTLKMASRIKMLYEQMPDPKYVISMGNCSNCGGPYWEHGYHVLKGVDRIIPVDVYVPGCPPRPEALLEGLIRLQEKIRAQG